ncbi:hypothetical protein K0B96_15520 [Horticoccus luteus]|uniref:Uncharacterized protein n=1 Tax=Horticoccus luteus TaxID=2862869 RepID=A0A8F9TTC3_9BACT|nr:hypothetical protein [Horticoccus luteus]QYM78691.1 hypothetical protein K0B96_15520 [Horticoccus luteus]
MSHQSSLLAALDMRTIYYPTRFQPVEQTAAEELARLTGATARRSVRPGQGVNLALASRAWAKSLPAAQANTTGWMWLKLAEDGTGEIIADTGALLYAAVRLLAHGLGDDAREKLARGLFLPATFPHHRPHWDSCLTQYWRSVRKFDREKYIATLAESGFTHVEVNGLQAHMPFEDTVVSEFYPQFYTYCAGFNHFVDTPLTAGLWPTQYLEANLQNLQQLAALGRKYGLQPGLCMFEPRSMPERLFQRYPTLRGARVDHPFRSRLPRYCLAQDHPVTKQHYRAALQSLIKTVPDLSYLSVWSNDSGAGFEHTGSLYVGRNGGPYMIREWRNHEKIAEAAGQSIVRYLRNLQQSAAELNPDFDIFLRLEPFKLEQDYIKAGMGNHIAWEAPSLLVRGYSLPYTHPKYPTMSGVAGSPLQTEIDASERKVLAESRAQGVEPTLQYAIGTAASYEPLLGIPYPRLLHKKLTAMRELGLKRISGYGGLNNPQQTPYWPNPAVIRAAQFMPDKSIDDVLLDAAREFVGANHAPALVACWDAFDEALSWQPPVALFTVAFSWQRTFDRPYVPDIEAIPAQERAYYERFGCFQYNNPSLNDIGKDVLFDLVTREQGGQALAGFDQNVIPRVEKLLARLAQLEAQTAGEPSVQAVFSDLLDRTRAYRALVGSLRMVCAWCTHVYGYIESTKATDKKKHERALQTAIDDELVNTANLIALLEANRTEVMILSAIGNNTFCYGEDLPDLLREKIRLMKKYRHHPPRIDQNILWRPLPGSQWPKFD